MPLAQQRILGLGPAEPLRRYERPPAPLTLRHPAFSRPQVSSRLHPGWLQALAGLPCPRLLSLHCMRRRIQPLLLAEAVGAPWAKAWLPAGLSSSWWRRPQQ